jgi:hypothetical protein
VGGVDDFGLATRSRASVTRRSDERAQRLIDLARAGTNSDRDPSLVD